MEEDVKDKFISKFKDPSVREVMNEKKYLLDKLEIESIDEIVRVNVNRCRGKDLWVFKKKDNSEIIIEE